MLMMDIIKHYRLAINLTFFINIKNPFKYNILIYPVNLRLYHEQSYDRSSSLSAKRRNVIGNSLLVLFCGRKTIRRQILIPESFVSRNRHFGSYLNVTDACTNNKNSLHGFCQTALQYQFAVSTINEISDKVNCTVPIYFTMRHY